MKKCPYCAESIQDEAVKCRYCGEWLDERSINKLKKKTSLKAEKKHNKDESYSNRIRNRYMQMAIDELVAFKESFNPDDYAPEVQEIIKKVFIEREDEIRNYKKQEQDPVYNEKETKNEFDSGEKKAKYVKAFLIFTMIILIGSIFSNIYQLDLLSRIESGSNFTIEEANSIDILNGAIYIINLIVYIITAITFLIWFSNSYKNLTIIGSHKLRYKSKWTVLGFIIPILNLFIPYQIMKEIWVKSDPSIVFSTDGNENNSRSDYSISYSHVKLWWFFFLFGNSTSYISNYYYSEEGMVSLKTATTIEILSDIIWIVSAIITICLINHIILKQKRRYRRIKSEI